MYKIAASEVGALIAFLLIISGLISGEYIYFIGGFIISIFVLNRKGHIKKKNNIRNELM